MTKLHILVFLFFTGICAHGQRDAANWYFGNFVGLDFNLGNPQSFDDGALDTTEGCSAISDKDTGETLFYTEGTTVWNRNNEVMLNGFDLLGSVSSTQSAVIVPLPNSTDLFYIITTDVVQAYQTNGIGNGINYSVVSMSGDNGLGEVIEKNTNILLEGSEKVTVVETGDGVNYWIVTHYQDRFYSFLLNASGLDFTPVISTIGPNIDNFENYRGAMKLSPDGSHLAIAHCLFEPSLGGLAYLYDFNNDTGVVSNQQLLSDDLVYYGVEFSSDSSKLYFSGKTLDNVGQSDRNIIEQYDLNQSSVPNTRFTISDQESELLSDLAGALQIAMNKKIYHSLPSTTLSVINQPKLPGASSSFSRQSVNLGFRISSFGLPQYIQSFFESFITIENTCENDMTSFTVDPLQNVTGALWDFGDSFSGADNTSTLINPTHVYSNPGFYTITVEFQFSDRAPKTFIEFIEIIPQLELPSTLEFNQCDIDGSNDGTTIFNLENLTDIALGLGDLQYNFFQSLSDAQQFQNIISEPEVYENVTNGENIYLVVGDSLDCNTIVVITLNVSPSGSGNNFTYSLCDVLLSQTDVWFALELLAEQILMAYPSDSTIEYYLTFDQLVAQANQLSLDNVPHSFTALNFENVFYRVSQGASCLATGEVTFDILASSEEENKSIIFCVSDGGITLETDNPYLSYLWSTGETTPTIFIDEPGIYNLEFVTLSGCDGRLQFIVEEVNSTEVSIEVNEFQQSNSIIITPDDTSIELIYSIDGGLTFQDNGIFTGLVAATYSVIVRDLQGCSAINELVEVGGAPRFFTPNGDGVKDFWHVNNKENYPELKVTIMDRFGKRITSLTSTSPGWDGTFNGQEMPSNAYWYRISHEGKEYYGHFSLIRRGS